MQQAEMEQVRQEEANRTALAAIGGRKKRKVETPSSVSSIYSTGITIWLVVLSYLVSLSVNFVMLIILIIGFPAGEFQWPGQYFKTRGK